MSEIVRCAKALAGDALRRDFAFAIDDRGRISDAGDFNAVLARNAALPSRTFPADRIVVPGFVNGHSHAYQILLRGRYDDMTFERWRDDGLYRIVPQLEPKDVYWVFVAAFSEMLAAGITTVAEFFYLNGRGNAHAEAAIRAAADVGIRLVLARAWMDAEEAPDAFRETVEQARERTRELRRAHSNVCIAPHSLHGASEQMLRAAAEFSAEEDCDLHVHVAETHSEVALAIERYGVTAVLALDRLGVLTERTVAVHAIAVTEAEKDVLALRGVRVVRCPSTNSYLGDGLGDTTGLRRRGVCLGLGTDANVKPSIIDEMRAASYEQKTLHCDAAAMDAASVYELATRGGARALRTGLGDLAVGADADFLVLDASRIDPWSPAVNGIVYRGEAAWVQAAFVGGRRVYTGEPSALAAEARHACKYLH